MAKNPQKSAFQITSPCYCWLWDCEKNKTKTCTFLTSQWVCIHKIVWNRLTLMNMCCNGKVPAFRENEAIKSKWTTNHKMFKDRTKIETPIIFLFVLLNFFSPRNFDTFHLNKNRNHSRTSYKTTGQWNKKKKLCVEFWKSPVSAFPRSTESMITIVGCICRGAVVNSCA